MSTTQESAFNLNEPFLPDFSEATQSEMLPVPPGAYKARIEGVVGKLSKNNERYLRVDMSIFGAEGDLAKFNNRKFNTIAMLQGKGVGGLRDLMRACKIEGTLVPTQLIGKEVLAILKEGRTQPDGTVSTWPEVKAIRPLV